MIDIYLCDDESLWLKRLEKAVVNYQINSDLEMNITYQTTSPEALLEHISQHTSTKSIYFLDINLKSNINGMELATQIRTMDYQASIVFVTTHDEMVMETFRLKLSVLDYIIKDTFNFEEQIHQCLNHIEKQLLTMKQEVSDALLLRIAGSYQIIPPKEVYFIEAIKNTHKICIHLYSGMYEIPSTLSSIKGKIGADFFQCHKACLVNLKHINILESDGHQLILDNGDICYCSVREWRQLIRKLKAISNHFYT